MPCNKDRGEKHLVDDKVNICLSAIRDKIGASGKLLVAIDACHSGDATRDTDSGEEVARGVADVSTPTPCRSRSAPCFPAQTATSITLQTSCAEHL